MNIFFKLGNTNKLFRGGVMLLTMAVGAGVLLTVYQVMFGEEDRLLKEVNQVLGDKGYVKTYDRKQRVYIIELNAGSSFTELEKLKGVFENLFKSEVEIVNDNFRYYVKLVEKKVIPNIVPFQLFDTSHDEGMKVAVAQGSDAPIFLDFTKVPHTLVAGSTGWGKSVFTKSLILQIINNFP